MEIENPGITTKTHPSKLNFFLSSSLPSRCCYFHPLSLSVSVKLARSHLLFLLRLICSEVRECLKLDPDHKQCYSHYKQVKKLNKQIQSAEELMQEQRYWSVLCVCINIFVCLANFLPLQK